MTQEPPILDPAALDALRAAAPKESNLVERVVTVWLRDAPERVAEARRAVQAGDRETAHRAVHSLKSASATVGALRLAERCRTAEKAYGNGLLDPGLLEDVERERAQAAEALQAIPELVSKK